jgi:galactose-1-phosphate uridylyltransferase
LAQDFQQGLYAYLSTNATITALISTRLYPDILPQDVTYPAVVFRQIGNNDDDGLQAASTLLRPIYEFEAQAQDGDDPYAAARQVIRAITSVLQDYAGAMGNCIVGAVLRGEDAEDYDPDKNVYWASREFEFFVTEG